MALLGGGGYGEYAVADERSVIAVPGGMDLHIAGAIPETFLTAFQLIHFIGGTKPGDRVLVHAAGSGVGLAVCQLLRAHGAVPIATARTAAKLEVAREHGAEFTIDTKEKSDFADKVMEVTEGKGADVILDPVGGSYSAPNAKCIAVDGRWVVYGLMGGPQLQVEAAMGVLQRKRATITGTTLRSRSLEYKGQLVEAMWKVAAPLFEAGTLKTVIDDTIPFEEAGKAHALMESNSNTGKIVLRVVADDFPAKKL